MVCEPFLFWGENREMPLKCREMRENAPKFAGVVAGVNFWLGSIVTPGRARNMGTPANPQLPG